MELDDLYENHATKEYKPKVFKRVEVKLLTGDGIGKSNGKGREGF